MRVATGGARRLLRPAMVAIVMATMAGTLLSSWSRVPWRDYLRRHPPSVVELSFVKPQTLPSQARAGALIQFGFKVANRRSERLTVGWTTQMESVDMRTVQTVATGVIT